MRPRLPSCLAEGATARKGVAHDGVARRVVCEADERPRPFAAIAQETRVPERRRVPRDVRLALLQELRELADAELLLRREREQAQPRRLGEHAIELPAVGRGGLGGGHDTEDMQTCA